MWTFPSRAIRATSGPIWKTARVTVFDRATEVSRFIRPYERFRGAFSGPFDLSTVAYRFNWDSPIAFAPFVRSGARDEAASSGGSAGTSLRDPRDRGETWTRDQPRSHAQHQGTSAALGRPARQRRVGRGVLRYDALIEGSPLDRGEIWVGTDDGYAQMTRDGGAHGRTSPAGNAGVRAHRSSRTLAARRGNGVRRRGQPSHGRLRAVRIRDARLRLNLGEDRQRTAAPINTSARSGPTFATRTCSLPARRAGMWISLDAGAHWQDFRSEPADRLRCATSAYNRSSTIS